MKSLLIEGTFCRRIVNKVNTAGAIDFKRELDVHWRAQSGVFGGPTLLVLEHVVAFHVFACESIVVVAIADHQ